METIIFSETSIVSWLDGWWLMAGVENENVVNVLVILIVCHFVSSCVINDTFLRRKVVAVIGVADVIVPNRKNAASHEKWRWCRRQQQRRLARLWEDARDLVVDRLEEQIDDEGRRGGSMYHKSKRHWLRRLTTATRAGATCRKTLNNSLDDYEHVGVIIRYITLRCFYAYLPLSLDTKLRPLYQNFCTILLSFVIGLKRRAQQCLHATTWCNNFCLVAEGGNTFNCDFFC